MKGIRELKGTFAFKAMLHELDLLAQHADSNIIMSANTKPIEDIRYKAGIATGIRQVISALTAPEE